jgi:hypothetical protein
MNILISLLSLGAAQAGFHDMDDDAWSCTNCGQNSAGQWRVEGDPSLPAQMDSEAFAPHLAAPDQADLELHSITCKVVDYSTIQDLEINMQLWEGATFGTGDSIGEIRGSSSGSAGLETLTMELDLYDGSASPLPKAYDPDMSHFLTGTIANSGGMADYNLLLESCYINYNITAQNIQLAGAWNTISTFMEAADMDPAVLFADLLIENDVFEVGMEGVANTMLQMVKDQDGKVFWPYWNFNGIGDLAVEKGYQVRMFGDATVAIEGDPVTAIEYVYTAVDGWSIIGHIPKGPVDAVELFAELLEEMDEDLPFIVKANDGSVYWPDYEFNGIGDMQPGQGYWLGRGEAPATTFAVPYSYEYETEY